MEFPWKIFLITISILATVVQCTGRRRGKYKQGNRQNNKRKGDASEQEHEFSGNYDIQVVEEERTEKPVNARNNNYKSEGGKTNGEFVFTFGTKGSMTTGASTPVEKEKVENEKATNSQYVEGSAKVEGSFQQSGRTMQQPAEKVNIVTTEAANLHATGIKEEDISHENNASGEKMIIDNSERTASIESIEHLETSEILETEGERDENFEDHDTSNEAKDMSKLEASASGQIKIDGNDTNSHTVSGESKVTIKFGPSIKRKESKHTDSSLNEDKKEGYGFNGTISSNTTVSFGDSAPAVQDDSVMTTETTEKSGISASGSSVVKISFGPKTGKKVAENTPPTATQPPPPSNASSASDQGKIAYESHVKMEAGQGEHNHGAGGNTDNNAHIGNGGGEEHTGHNNKNDRRHQHREEKNQNKLQKQQQRQDKINNKNQYGNNNNNNNNNDNNHQQQNSNQNQQQPKRKQSGGLLGLGIGK